MLLLLFIFPSLSLDGTLALVIELHLRVALEFCPGPSIVRWCVDHCRHAVFSHHVEIEFIPARQEAWGKSCMGEGRPPLRRNSLPHDASGFQSPRHSRTVNQGKPGWRASLNRGSRLSDGAGQWYHVTINLCVDHFLGDSARRGND